MYLEIITPDETVFEGEVNATTLPGAYSSFQVLNNHAALISSLTSGLVLYDKKGKRTEVKISGGVVEVLNNKVVVLAESASKA
ncbi:MAG: ATP synthase F1 subunit epsilon [Cyclobacteriaceae bacterium]|nr:ATP synthase F1 subunit epsilon [Cyclobacteriaceae bacterium]MCH8516133.1 ATP synthase F1 subunit epsilon [Cyclobacteriaceae bacterium]